MGGTITMTGGEKKAVIWNKKIKDSVINIAVQNHYKK
jgi:hypothetical protein